MGQLVLVRHAKASFMAADYDQLSEPGMAQSRAVGRYWSQQGWCPDVVYCGPRRRHAQTLDAAAHVAAEHGLEWPSARPLDAFDEHQGMQLMQAALPDFIASDPQAKAWSEGMAEGGAAMARNFQRLYEALTRRWVRGEINPPGVETWRAFRARVAEGLDEIIRDATHGQSTVVFTSAGSIGASVASVLGLDDEKALELGWSMWNASLTRVQASTTRRSLMTFNETPHLTPDALSYPQACRESDFLGAQEERCHACSDGARAEGQGGAVLATCAPGGG